MNDFQYMVHYLAYFRESVLGDLDTEELRQILEESYTLRQRLVDWRQSHETDAQIARMERLRDIAADRKERG